jgi:predicted GNAT superfamily acetyltransferase
MSVDLTRLDPAAQAAAAARAADLEVGEIEDVDGLQRMTALLDEVWSIANEGPLIAANTLKALSHSGNYVAGAWSSGELVGAVVGFLGRHRSCIRTSSALRHARRDAPSVTR